jgi:hypothetical protein
MIDIPLTSETPKEFLTYLEGSRNYKLIELILRSMDVGRQRTDVLTEYRNFLTSSSRQYATAVAFLQKVDEELQKRAVLPVSS